MSDSCRLPEFSLDQAAALARSRFGLDGPIRSLDGERDLNFLIDDARGRFVFKIANIDEAPEMLECQHQVFARLAAAQVFPLVAQALASVDGKLIEVVRSAGGDTHACRALPFIEGQMLAQLSTLSAPLLADLGRCLARLDQALESFSHPALERPLLWKMDQALETVESFGSLLTYPARLDLVAKLLATWREQVVPRLAGLRRAVIHNDANRNNVLTDAAGTRIISIIDFGDMVESWLVVEPAIAATYAMLEQAEPLAVAQRLLQGYHATLALSEDEISVIPGLIGMRLCLSVTICAHQLRLEPDNEYLALDIESTWALLEQLSAIDYTSFRDALLDACKL